MYKSCLVCHHDLGSNGVLGHSRVGRELAFDARSGRLWILCTRCHSWNLTPYEERWEALEECERQFEASARRYATENIGLAEIADGVRLIRVAGPPLREFAAWRYGRRFITRRYRALTQTAGAAVFAGGALAFGGGLLFGASAVALSGYITVAVATSLSGRRGHVLAQLPMDDNTSYPITHEELKYLRLLQESNESWVVDTQVGTVFRGPARLQALAIVMPFLNRWGGKRDHQDEAVRLIQEAGGPEAYLANLKSHEFQTIRSWTRIKRLAVEIAVNEDVERRALEGELRLLLAAWREAEAVADIADALFVPLPVERRFWQLKATVYARSNQHVER